MNQKISRSFGTHDGIFHSDEVCACALLLVYDLIDEDKITRTRDPKELKECEYVCDVGGKYEPQNKLFDHHQVEYKGEKSSAGMILEYLLDQKMIKQKEYNCLQFSLVRGIDAFDNGRVPQNLGFCTFSQVISNFAPIDYDATRETMNKAFMHALDFSKGHIQRQRDRYFYTQKCKDVVDKAMQKNKHCLYFEKSMPWLENFFDLGGIDHPAEFVIMPSGKHWNLRGIPPSLEERTKVRKPLPENWAGLLEDQLKEVTKIKGAIFCHKGRFISVWETKEDALKALKQMGVAFS